MRISDIILESEQLDEISLAGVGQGIGKAVRGTSSAVHGIKGAWQGAKDAWAQGSKSFGSARSAVASQPQLNPTPEIVPQSSPSPTPKITVAQINGTIPSLRTRDLQSIKKTVDAALAKKQPAAAPVAQPKLKVQPGGAVK